MAATQVTVIHQALQCLILLHNQRKNLLVFVRYNALSTFSRSYNLYPATVSSSIKTNCQLLRKVEKNLLKNVAGFREELLTCGVSVTSGQFSLLGDVPFMLYVNVGSTPIC
ncbi:MAG TPA: hypothetical protein V6C91_05865 [Coleofasciculaceae cyanobacterium]